MRPPRKRTTKKQIARDAQIGPDFFSHILWGRRACPHPVAVRLEEVTGIKKDIWTSKHPKELRNIVEEYIYSE
jgi:plasmid maintenance system antidote protein VapI